MILVCFKGKPFNITIIQLYTPTTDAKEAEVDQFYEDLQDLLELTEKRRPFHYRGLDCKSRKSRDTWNNKQVWPWSKNEAEKRPTDFCQKNKLVIANTLFHQHKRRLYTWSQQMVKTKIRLIIFFATQDGEALYSQQKQDRKLTVAQIMNSLLPNSDLN